MFGSIKKTGETGNAHDIETIIGKNTSIKGEMTGSGNIRVDGRIEGGISITGNVVIGSSGDVVGNIKAENLLVSGSIKGNVDVAGNLSVFSSGQLIGDAKTTAFSIEEGGVFRGHSEMAAKKKDGAEIVEIKQSKKA
jgi:cytoskeletal protein CcmA (bactofilin family)